MEQTEVSNTKECQTEQRMDMAFSRSGEFLTVEYIQGAGMTEEQILEIFHSQQYRVTFEEFSKDP